MCHEVRGGGATRRGRCEMSNIITLHDRDIVTTAERGREFRRGVLLAGALIATIGAVGALGAGGEHARPLGFAPTSGSIEGGRLIFVDIDEGPPARGRATVTCRLG